MTTNTHGRQYLHFRDKDGPLDESFCHNNLRVGDSVLVRGETPSETEAYRVTDVVHEVECEDGIFKLVLTNVFLAAIDDEH